MVKNNNKYMKKEKIWTWATEQEFKDYEEYEKNLPQNILEEYGEKLEEDTDNLLTYEIFTQTTYNETLSNIVGFLIGPKINNYKLNAFQLTYPFDKVYPCKVYCMFTENTFYATDYENLKEIIEMEIQNQRTSKALSGLIHHFYDKETIKNAMKDTLDYMIPKSLSGTSGSSGVSGVHDSNCPACFGKK